MIKGGENMKEEQVIQLLRHYRHDWLNELQLIMGYVQMGKLDKAQEKIKQAVAHAEVDRKIQSIPMPKTALWITKFGWCYTNLELTYEIEVKQTVNACDQSTVRHLEEAMDCILSGSMKTNLYHGTIRLQQKEQSQLQIVLEITGEFQNLSKVKQQLEQLDLLMDIKLKTTNHVQQTVYVAWVENGKGDNDVCRSG